MNVVITACVDSFRTLKDNTVKLVLHTNEMEKEKAADLYSLTNQYVKVHLTDSNITKEQVQVMNDTKVEVGELVNGKTKAQRIRNILYLYWQKEKPMENFDDFYNIEMERIIELLKETYL